MKRKEKSSHHWSKFLQLSALDSTLGRRSISNKTSDFSFVTVTIPLWLCPTPIVKWNFELDHNDNRGFCVCLFGVLINTKLSYSNALINELASRSKCPTTLNQINMQFKNLNVKLVLGAHKWRRGRGRGLGGLCPFDFSKILLPSCIFFFLNVYIYIYKI